MPILDKKKVVVAMSGGVDSAVAALLLREKGYEVIGISMKTHESHDGENLRSKTCCSINDIHDARRVCQHLDIPFYALDFTKEFHAEVILPFGKEYSQGRTPNPCALCNRELKFNALFEKTRELGAYFLATGHYARKVRTPNGQYHLCKSVDREKDQTYFLFNLGQNDLEHLLFPVGQYTKNEIREFAASAGLQVAQKPESQEICFVPDNDHARFIETILPQYAGAPGNFVDEEGNILGTHRGIHAYTVGQRRGLGVAMGERRYVTKILTDTNEIILSEKESLQKKGVLIDHVHFVSGTPVPEHTSIEIKIRHQPKGIRARIEKITQENVLVFFDEPNGAVTPGQVSAFYVEDELIGGGWIVNSIEGAGAL